MAAQIKDELPEAAHGPMDVSADIVINVENLSKAYTIWSSPAARLHGPLLGQIGQMTFLPTSTRQLCQRMSHQSFRNFWALKGVSFQVARGECVGIIGRNGSGKSTLLQVVAGTLEPTEGSVTTRGRVAALLELGSGFNPEFTGRENAFLNAAVLGLSREETEAKFEEIESFADIGDFIDQPTKTYSSGMVVRLAFAVAVCVNPEVLIIDEALSVGDVFFQQKCFTRIREILDEGTTMLFVSHDAAAVQNLCKRAILLKQGEPVFEGPPQEAVSRYYAMAPGRAAGRFTSAPAPGERRSSAEVEELRRMILAHNILTKARSSHGIGQLVIEAAAFLNELGQHAMNVEALKPATIHLLLRAHAPIQNPTAGIHLYDRLNNLVFAAGSQQLRVPLSPMAAGERRAVSIQLTFSVQPGDYTFSLGCAEVSAEGPNVGNVQNRHEGLGPVHVHADRKETLRFYGIANLPMRISEWASA